MKVCNSCQKPGEFRADKRNKDGMQGICRECQRSYQRLFNIEYNGLPEVKEYKRDHRISKFWPGADLKQASENYNSLFQKQSGCCAICGGHQNSFNKALAIDHDHKTGSVRGLLCGNCNRGLGMFRDRPFRLRLAALYLEGKNED